jgi:hypothetical protein
MFRRRYAVALYLGSLADGLGSAAISRGADFRTESFLITASTPELARELGEQAERVRREVAREWLGHPLPPWQEPCSISAAVEPRLESHGQTSYVFNRGQAASWQIFVQGSRRAVLESVLPHEMTHAVFAAHFGRPLPCWADEGASISMELGADRQELETLFPRRLQQGRVLSLTELFATRNYPRDPLPLYAESLSVVRFLLTRGGKQEFVSYLGDGIRSRDWAATTRTHYGYATLEDLEQAWLTWVRLGSGDSTTLAVNGLSGRAAPRGRRAAR